MSGSLLARRAVAAAALAGLLFGFDTAVISGVATPFAQMFGLSEAEKGVVVASALLGTLVAALFAGIPGDRYGARTALRWIALAFIVSSLGCALAWDFTSFTAFRVLGGLAIGGASVVAPVFIAEISPASRRGALVGLFQVAIVCGILGAYFSNFLIAGAIATEDAWRWKMAVLALPGALLLAALRSIPNSPRWLAANGRVTEAANAARLLGLDDWAVAEPGAADARLSWRLHRKPILLALVIASFNQLSGINPILYYLNDIFAAGGFSTVSADLQAIAIGTTNLLATLAAMTVIDRVGRRPLLLCGAAGTGISLAGVALAYSVPGREWLLLPLLIVFVAFFALSQGAVIWVYLSEIFPTPVRARGQALGSTTHWLWATLLSFGFPVVAERFSQALPFWIFAFAMVAQFLIVWRWFPETRQVQLEDMDAALTARNVQDTQGAGNA